MSNTSELEVSEVQQMTTTTTPDSLPQVQPLQCEHRKRTVTGTCCLTGSVNEESQHREEEEEFYIVLCQGQCQGSVKSSNNWVWDNLAKVESTLLLCSACSRKMIQCHRLAPSEYCCTVS